MIGDGISDRAKPKLIPTVLLTKKVHQPLRTVAFFLVKVDPADRGIHAQRQVATPQMPLPSVNSPVSVQNTAVSITGFPPSALTASA